MKPKAHILIDWQTGEARVRKLCHDARLIWRHKLTTGTTFKVSYGLITVK